MCPKTCLEYFSLCKFTKGSTRSMSGLRIPKLPSPFVRPNDEFKANISHVKVRKLICEGVISLSHCAGTMLLAQRGQHRPFMNVIYQYLLY